MKKQQGFTIIELVVVILLLSILAATALPRFMDVTDEAHDAKVQGVYGGLGTGISLFRAQWIAEGQPTSAVIEEFGSLYPNSFGYPVGTIDNVLDESDDCLAVFQGVLQNISMPTLLMTTSGGGNITGVGLEPDDENDFLVKHNSDGDGSCEYAYVGMYKDSSEADLPVIIYDPVDGVVALSATDDT